MIRVIMLTGVELPKGKGRELFFAGGTYNVKDELAKEWIEQKKAYKEGDPKPEEESGEVLVVKPKPEPVPVVESKPEPVEDKDEDKDKRGTFFGSRK